MYLSGESIIVILFVGLVAGWLAGKIVRGTGFGIIGDILVGIAGAFIATLLFPRLGIRLGTGLVSEIIYSAIGAIILLLIVRLVRTGGRWGRSRMIRKSRHRFSEKIMRKQESGVLQRQSLKSKVEKGRRSGTYHPFLVAP